MALDPNCIFPPASHTGVHVPNIHQGQEAEGQRDSRDTRSCMRTTLRQQAEEGAQRGCTQFCAGRCTQDLAQQAQQQKQQLPG